MPTKLMMVFVAMDFLFAACGGLLLGFSLMSEKSMRDSPTVNNISNHLLLDQCPLTGTTFPQEEGKSSGQKLIARHHRGADP